MPENTNRASAIRGIPANRSFFLPVQSEFFIKRLPDVEFFCQRVELPGVAMSPTREYNPLVDIKHPGDVVNFNEFSVTFKVDERMANYLSVMDWIVRLGFPKNHDQYLSLSEKSRWSGDGIFSDCSVFFLNSRGRPQIEATFHEAFPIGISNLVVDSTAEDTQFTTVTATFAYTMYEMNIVT